VKQYDFLKEPDILHANVNAGKIAVSCSELEALDISLLDQKTKRVR